MPNPAEQPRGSDLEGLRGHIRKALGITSALSTNETTEELDRYAAEAAAGELLAALELIEGENNAST